MPVSEAAAVKVPTHLLLPQVLLMCSGEGQPCHTARCAEHCGCTAQFYPSDPSRGQAAPSGLWNDCSFTTVFAFLSLLW